MSDIHPVLERVARAICAELASDCNEVVNQDLTIAEVVDDQWKGFVPTARLSVIAITAPSIDMVSAGAAHISDGMFDGSVRAERCHQAMMRAILGDSA